MFAKVITLIISPLGTAIVLALAGLLTVSTCPLLALALVSLAIAWLWLWSTPMASDMACGWLERRAGSRALNQLPHAAVAVVLGGAIHGARPPARPYPGLGSSADRVWHAARIYHAGLAPKLLLSGGPVHSGDGTEASAMRDLLLDLGVPSAALILESDSQTTAENAIRSAALLRQRRVDEVLLVTSAFHMPRARKLFTEAGVKVHPAPTDFQVIAVRFDGLRVLPTAEALEASGRAFKEFLGLLIQ